MCISGKKYEIKTGGIPLCPAILWGADAPPKDGVPVPMAVFNFDKDMLGKPPSRFTLAVSGEGPAVHWEVRRPLRAISAECAGPKRQNQTGEKMPRWRS